MKKLTRFLLALFTVGMVGLSACGDTDVNIKDGDSTEVEDTNDLGNDIEDAANDAAREIDSAADKAGEAIDSAAEDVKDAVDGDDDHDH